MNQQTQSQATAPGSSDEVYSIADREVQQSYVGSRTAREWVPFFLPHLRPGMAVLDCGCGVGSITLDLAACVAPGPVVGIDIDESQLAIARAEADRRGLTNVRFEVANVYELPFADAAFDAVLAHTLLVHLRDPGRVLAGLRQVLKPGGVACVSDDDFSTIVFSPADPIVQRVTNLWTQLLEHNGGNPFYARHLRGLLLEAGFGHAEGFAVVAEQHGNAAATRRVAGYMDVLLSNPAVIAPIISQGWADEAELRRMRDGVLAWGDRPDAFFAWMYCAALGWVGSDSAVDQGTATGIR